MKRKNFIKSLLGLSGASLLTGLYTFKLEPYWLEFVHQRLSINNLPEKLIGKTIMQISDIHVGNKFDFNFIINSFKRAQKYKPDFVVYTGDYVSYENATQLDQLQYVLEDVVLGKIATYGILGNHDYGFKWKNKKLANQITSILRKSGIRVLRNNAQTVSGLNFIGIDDYWSSNFNPKKAMKYYKPDNANIVLCHNPDVCDLSFWGRYQGWILSGHTHGGQCKPPFLRPPILPVKNKKYSSGKIDLQDGRMLYVNRALGMSTNVRFNVRPEITIFTLEKMKV